MFFSNTDYALFLSLQENKSAICILKNYKRASLYSNPAAIFKAAITKNPVVLIGALEEENESTRICSINIFIFYIPEIDSI